MNADPDLLKMTRESPLELQLWTQIEEARLPLPAWQVDILGHKVDFAWPEPWLYIVEVQGGTDGFGKGRGRHVREPGYSEDRARAIEYQLAGWMVFEFTRRMLDSGEALDWLRRAFNVAS